MKKDLAVASLFLTFLKTKSTIFLDDLHLKTFQLPLNLTLNKSLPPPHFSSSFSNFRIA